MDLPNLLILISTFALFLHSRVSDRSSSGGNIHIGWILIYSTTSLRSGGGERASEIERLFHLTILCCIPLHLSPGLLLSLSLIHRWRLFPSPHLRGWGYIAIEVRHIEAVLASSQCCGTFYHTVCRAWALWSPRFQ